MAIDFAGRLEMSFSNHFPLFKISFHERICIFFALQFVIHLIELLVKSLRVLST